MTVQSAASVYPARLEVDYPEQHDRVTTLFRVVLIIPIGIVISVLTAGANRTVYDQSGQVVRSSSGGITAGLFLATLLMIVFRKRYPRWWFDFALELARFGARVQRLLRAAHRPVPLDGRAAERPPPDRLPRCRKRPEPLAAAGEVAARDPAHLALIVLSVAAFFAVVIAWFAILLTGRYPRGLFDFVVSVGRWWLRVQAYAILLVTDRYPPFALT